MLADQVCIDCRRLFTTTTALVFFGEKEKVIIAQAVRREALVRLPNDRLEPARVDHRLAEQQPVIDPGSRLVVTRNRQVAAVSFDRLAVAPELTQCAPFDRKDCAALLDGRLELFRCARRVERSLVCVRGEQLLRSTDQDRLRKKVAQLLSLTLGLNRLT